MKKILLYSLILFLGFSCASNKNKRNKSPDKPVAEISLAPGHIHALVEITDIIDSENGQTIYSLVKKVMDYGSSTQPVPAESSISFSITQAFSDELKNTLKKGEKIAVILSDEGSQMMMGNQKNRTWKLISIQ